MVKIIKIVVHIQGFTHSSTFRRNEKLIFKPVLKAAAGVTENGASPFKVVFKTAINNCNKWAR